MLERKWKLGDDMHQSDCILDPITFDDIILAVHHNARVLNESAVRTAVREILEIRMQDFEYILNNNINEIIAEAKRERE